MLHLENIKKQYADVEVLHSLSLSVKEGEFISLLGASGCGKTTLLRIIAGLEPPSAGTVCLGREDVTAWSPSKRNIAMVFQSYALYPHKTVAENIAFPLRMRAPSMARIPLVGRFTEEGKKLSATIAEKVPAVAEALNLGALLGRKPSQLSGGQKQRVALARALVREPSLFLMDEPLSNLDAKLRTEMRREIIELHRNTGKTFVYVTHDQTEAMTMSDRIVLLNQGSIQQIGTPIEIYENPVNLFTASFIGSPSIAVLQCTVDGEGLRVGEVRMTSDAAKKMAGALGHGQYQLGIRAEACSLVDAKTTDAVPMTVRLVEHMGNERLVHMDVDNMQDAEGQAVPACIRVPNTVHVPEEHAFICPDWSNVFFFNKEGLRVRPQAKTDILRTNSATVKEVSYGNVSVA